MSSSVTSNDSTSSSSASSSSSSSGKEDSSVVERSVHLSDGRVLHYAVGGDLSSRRIFLGLHGVFGIGAIPEYQSRKFSKKGWITLAPTLPGWGQSSPFPLATPISAYVSDICQLIDDVMAIKHESNTKPTHIVVFGGSYGSVWAYAVAANSPVAPSTLRLEPGSIRGLIVMGGFSPFHHHSTYGEGMSMMNYLTVGKFGLYPPFSWLHSLIGNIIRKQVANNLEGSLKVLRSILTGEKAMTLEERKEMIKWTNENGITFEEWELSMAKNMSKSIANTLDGYHRVSETLNSDWGFRLENIQINNGNKGETVDVPASVSAVVATLPVLRIDNDHPLPDILPPIVLSGGLRDHLAHIQMMQWVNLHIHHSQLLELPGNHISGITSMMAIIEAVISGIEREDNKHPKVQ